MKKNKKQRFISDKISELKKQGKNQQESIAIALSMAENVLQEGGKPKNINELIVSADDKVTSKYRPIKKIQKGITNSKGQEGVYYYYDKVPGDPGFDPRIHRDFVTNQSMSEQTFKMIEPELYNPELQKYKELNTLKEGGDVELPKYQMAGQFGYKPNFSTFNLQDYLSKPVDNKPLPSTTYTGQKQNNFNFAESYKNPQLSIGQLDLNNKEFEKVPVTQNTVEPTKTEETITEEKPVVPQTVTSVFKTLPELKPIVTDDNKKLQELNNNLKENTILEEETQTPDFQTQTPPIQFANPYGGVDLNAASALFGQSIKEGDTAMGVFSGAKLGLGLARNFMSGYSASEDRNRTLNDYSSNMRNAMTGAKTPNQLYQEGGTANEQDQLLQQVMAMLQQGAQPEQIMQELINAGIPEQEAMQAIQMVMQQSQAPQQEQMMQEGGVAKQPEVPVEMANAEIEDGEYVQDTEGVKYAEGVKHSEGGIPTQLENGARVLSDYKKVGKDLSKQFSEQLGFEVKASDTFATVLDKFNRKGGFDKKVKHLDEYSDKLEKQEKTVKHDATLALNKQILMEEAQEDTQKLQELVQQQEGLFNILFEAQEASKGVETEGNFMQEGGTVNDLMAKYNISAEEAMKLVPSFQGLEGSSTFTGSDLEFERMKGKGYEQSNPYFFQNPGREGKLEDWTNSQMYKAEYDLGDVEAKKQRFKDLADNAGVPYTDADFKDSKSIDAFAGKLQKFIIENKPELAIDYGKKVEPTREGLQYLVDNKIINPEEYGIKLVNGKVARGSYDTLTTEADKKLNDVISKLPQDKVKDYALTNYNDNLGYFRGIKTREQELSEEEFNKFTSENKPVGSGYYETKVPGVYIKPTKIGETKTEPIVEQTIQETPMEIPTTPVVDIAQDKERNRLNFLNLPDQTPMLPWAMQAPAMTRQTIYAPRWNEISPEQQLTDIQRGRVATAEQMSFLPDSQQASSLFALDANAMSAQNKVRSETERYNQMARERTEAAEADQKTRQSAADVVAAQTYQQQLGNELESNEADWRSWYNRLNSNQLNNFMTVNEYNRSNSLNSDVQFTGQGYEVINTPTYSVDSSKIPMTQEPTKKKKSTKRFGK